MRKMQVIEIKYTDRIAIVGPNQTMILEVINSRDGGMLVYRPPYHQEEVIIQRKQK